MIGLDLNAYRLRDEDRVQTPALLVYPAFVDANIDATLRVMGGDANRWRPHLKTVKMPWVIRRLIERGVHQFKCATTLELLTACESGARNVLVAYPMVGANARRVIEIARQFSGVIVSVLVENTEQARRWAGTPIGVFIDVNPGMDRTGISESAREEIVAIAQSLGDQFRGIHYYDGHVTGADHDEREKKAHLGYDQLVKIIYALHNACVFVSEVITSGTPAFPSAMTYSGFRDKPFVHRASPGTVLFNDASSLGVLPPELGYRAAAAIMATVVSQPTAHRVTCDAGHKSVSADAGVPTCVVIGRSDLQPLKPSEEHLPIDVLEGSPIPAIGEALYLLPRHICPSVNHFDEALLVRGGQVELIEPVSARGHERALAGLV